MKVILSIINETLKWLVAFAAVALALIITGGLVGLFYGFFRHGFLEALRLFPS